MKIQTEDIITRTKIWLSNLTGSIKGLWRNKRALIMTWKGRTGLCITAAVILCIVIAVVSSGHRSPELTESTEKTGEKEQEEYLSMYAEVGNDRYEIRNKDGNQYLYINNKRKKKTTLSNIKVMDFNTASQTASKAIFSNRDLDIKDTRYDGNIYRGRTYEAENGIKYLKNKGFRLENYIVTSSYADLYFSHNGKTRRYLVIRQEGDTVAVIYGSCKGNGAGEIRKTVGA